MAVLSKKNILKIHQNDNVIVALCNLPKGHIININNKKIRLLNHINSKHKFSVEDLKKGDSIYMYGIIVGCATKKILKGELISRLNISHNIGNYKLNSKKKYIKWRKPNFKEFSNVSFMGYERKNGSVGVENNWLIIPLVFCQNRNIEVIKKTLLSQLGYEKCEGQKYNLETLINSFKEGASEGELMNIDVSSNENKIKKNPLFPNIDGIYFLTHEGGCGGSTSDSLTLCNLLAGYINNPNVAGATVLSLGCQHAQISILKKALKKILPKRQKPVYFLEQQQAKTEKEFLSKAIKKTFIGLIQANKISRKPAPLSKLTIGLECGGSDGFSGISANPTLGYVSDLIVAMGGSAILSEFPELNGVEQELIDRCTDIEKAKKFKNLMENYNMKATSFGAGFHANPSPGNIKDGLITDAIKSAGAAKKGGTSPIVDVLDYTEQVVKKGLNLLCTPGNDVESTTGLAGSGANLILFTTGLGTPTGNPAVPVIKVSSNTEIYNKMNDIVDFNTGSIIDGDRSIDSCGADLLKYIIKVASGEIIPHARRLGQNDFIPWKRGLSL